jgi:hypothetical protein
MPQNRWGRAVAYGFVVELVMIALAAVMQPLGQDPITVMAVAGSFLLPLLLAIELGRRPTPHLMAHGLVIGVVAMAIYLALTEAARRWGPPMPPQPFAYTVAHVLKLVGGIAGGWIAQRRA